MHKIIIDGHGGHCCEAHLEGTGKWASGYTISDAIGMLVQQHPEEFGIGQIEILPCSTTAYERSGVGPDGKLKTPEEFFTSPQKSTIMEEARIMAEKMEMEGLPTCDAYSSL